MRESLRVRRMLRSSLAPGFSVSLTRRRRFSPAPSAAQRVGCVLREKSPHLGKARQEQTLIGRSGIEGERCVRYYRAHSTA